MKTEDKENLEPLFKAIEWAKNHTYTGADEALNSLSELIGLKLNWKSEVWSSGEFYTIHITTEKI